MKVDWTKKAQTEFSTLAKKQNNNKKKDIVSIDKVLTFY